MTRVYASCSMLACFVYATATIAAADGPSDKVPELEALDSYVGSWDVQITTKGLPFTRGQSATKWTLLPVILANGSVWS